MRRSGCREVRTGADETICYDIVVSRTATLVQLNRELLAALDQRAAEMGVSRSQLIRDAVEAYLADTIDAAIDREIVEAYQREPQGDDPAWESALRASIDAEPW
jgi:predicted DNA-binding protein